MLEGARGFNHIFDWPGSLLTRSGRIFIATIIWGCGYPIFWSGREDSNLRPPHPQCDALPGCATPRPERRLLSSSSQRCKSVGAPCGFLWRGSSPVALPFLFVTIGSASCRDRVCQYV